MVVRLTERVSGCKTRAASTNEVRTTKTTRKQDKTTVFVVCATRFGHNTELQSNQTVDLRQASTDYRWLFVYIVHCRLLFVDHEQPLPCLFRKRSTQKHLQTVLLFRTSVFCFVLCHSPHFTTCNQKIRFHLQFKTCGSF